MPALFLLLFAAPRAQGSENTCVAEQARQPLVFSTFPSEGMGELFRRILVEAYGRIGREVKIVGMPAERALAQSDLGKVDGEAARVSVVEEQCANLIRVPTPLYINTVVGFSKNRDIDSSQGWEALRPYQLGLTRGYKYVEKQTRDMNRVILPTYDLLFNMLENDRIEVVVSEYLEGLAKMQGRNMAGVRLLRPPLARMPMYHYLHAKHKDLVPMIDAVLRDMAEGRLQEIFRTLESEYGGPTACRLSPAHP